MLHSTGQQGCYALALWGTPPHPQASFDTGRGVVRACCGVLPQSFRCEVSLCLSGWCRSRLWLRWRLSLARLSVSGASRRCRFLASWLRCGSRSCRVSLLSGGQWWLATRCAFGACRRGRVGLPSRCRSWCRGVRCGWWAVSAAVGCVVGWCVSGLAAGCGSLLFFRVDGEDWRSFRSVPALRLILTPFRSTAFRSTALKIR